MPRARRGRSLVGAFLAGMIALLLIAIVLAIVSKIGQLRLADLSSQQTATLLPRTHSSREALGLQAPAPLPEPLVRPQIPAPAETHLPAPVVPAPAPAPVVPPALQLPTAAAVPMPAPVQPAHRQPPIWQTLAALPYNRIYGAFLWRPATSAPPAPIERPTVSEKFVQLHRDSFLTPEAARQIAQERLPMQTLAQLRAQAAMARPPAPSTQPSS